MNKAPCQDKNIIVRRVVGAKSLRLSVGRNGKLVLRIPFWCSVKTVQAFLNRHQDWIREQQERPRLSFRDGSTLALLGQELCVRHQPMCRQGVFIDGTDLVVSGEEAFLNRRVTDFIKRQTARYIDEKARALAAQIGKKIGKITMKDTVSRWGSCSARGNLNFCWRLGLAPRYVLDYIIAHEVAHLQEMNHSDRFWRVVSRLCDRRSDAEIWLRRFGDTLR